MLIGTLLVVGAGLCFGVAWWLGREATQREGEIGWPLAQAQVVYSDSGAWEKSPQNLKSDTFGLVGKPDYILRTKTGIVPVEIKPLRHASHPYLSDVLQLAAYCLLLEEELGIAPPYGLLRYAARTFKIEWDAPLRQQLLDVLAEMRELQNWPAQIDSTMPSPQHDMTKRCDNCGFNHICWR